MKNRGRGERFQQRAGSWPLPIRESFPGKRMYELRFSGCRGLPSCRHGQQGTCVGRWEHHTWSPWPWKGCGACKAPRETQWGWNSLLVWEGRAMALDNEAGPIHARSPRLGWGYEACMKREEWQEDFQWGCQDLSAFLKDSWGQGLHFAHFLILHHCDLKQNDCLTYLLNCISVLWYRCFRNCV